MTRTLDKLSDAREYQRQLELDGHKSVVLLSTMDGTHIVSVQPTDCSHPLATILAGFVASVLPFVAILGAWVVTP